MSLTPKNWNTFQHYKERSPVWIKLHRGLLDDVQFQRLPIASKALAPMLWLYAAEYSDGTITEDWSDIAFRLRMTLDEFTQAVEPLIAKGFFISDAPAGEALAPRSQNACPEKRREEIETETETETEKSVSSVAKATRPVEPSRFDEFWQAYPRRKGDNPRKPAETKFNALVKTGMDPQIMIDAARKLAQSDKVGTEFIPMAATWINQQRWSDHAAVAATASLGECALSIEDAVKQYASFRRWPRGVGPEPGLAGCKASAELLASHGLRPDGGKISLGPRPFPDDDEPLEAA